MMANGCKPFSDNRALLFCFLQVVLFSDSSQISSWNFTMCCLFMVCNFFEQIYYAFAEKPDKLFWARVKEKTFAIVGKWLEHLESREILCVHRLKFLTVSVVPGYKILREWIRCLYNNVIDRLCVVTNRSTIDQKVQTLHLHTSQLVLNQDPIVCWG